jgi:hypothetical protein
MSAPVRRWKQVWFYAKCSCGDWLICSTARRTPRASAPPLAEAIATTLA